MCSFRKREVGWLSTSTATRKNVVSNSDVDKQIAMEEEVSTDSGKCT